MCFVGFTACQPWRRTALARNVGYGTTLGHGTVTEPSARPQASASCQRSLILSQPQRWAAPGS